MTTKTTTKKAAPLPHGIAERDLELLERLASDLAGLYRALRKGDTEAARAVHPRLMRIGADVRRVPLIAHRAVRAIPKDP